MAKNRVKVHGLAKTRNRALLGHPRRCVVRWVVWGVGVWDGGVGVWDGGVGVCGTPHKMAGMPLGAHRSL